MISVPGIVLAKSFRKEFKLKVETEYVFSRWNWGRDFRYLKRHKIADVQKQKCRRDGN